MHLVRSLSTSGRNFVDARAIPARNQRPLAACQTVCILKNIFGQKSSTSPKAKAALGKLLEKTVDSQRGLSTDNGQQRKEIEALFTELEECGRAGTPESVTGTWHLLWTTEKETLFIIKNAGIFGTCAGDVYQVIDTEAGTLQNVIEFPPDGAFIVDSDVEWAGGCRTNFKFNAASLKLPQNRKISLPPFGQGWFESVYVDERYRLCKDVRGDFLFVEKCGPPRTFE